MPAFEYVKKNCQTAHVHSIPCPPPSPLSCHQEITTGQDGSDRTDVGHSKKALKQMGLSQRTNHMRTWHRPPDHGAPAMLPARWTLCCNIPHTLQHQGTAMHPALAECHPNFS